MARSGSTSTLLRRKENTSSSVDEVLDVQGEICPYPDIKTRRKLKQMKPGQILKVTTDYPLSVERIPRNVVAEGHKVLKVERVNGPVHEIYIQVGEGKEKVGND